MSTKTASANICFKLHFEERLCRKNMYFLSEQSICQRNIFIDKNIVCWRNCISSAKLVHQRNTISLIKLVCRRNWVSSTKVVRRRSYVLSVKLVRQRNTIRWKKDSYADETKFRRQELLSTRIRWRSCQCKKFVDIT